MEMAAISSALLPASSRGDILIEGRQFIHHVLLLVSLYRVNPAVLAL
jgi:hypothetical protein